MVCKNDEQKKAYIEGNYIPKTATPNVIQVVFTSTV